MAHGSSRTCVVRKKTENECIAAERPARRAEQQPRPQKSPSPIPQTPPLALRVYAKAGLLHGESTIVSLSFRLGSKAGDLSRALPLRRQSRAPEVAAFRV